MASQIETYTINEVAESLKLHPYTVRRLCREGRIPGVKFGGQWRFHKKEIDNILLKGQTKIRQERQ
jgi:excisionase family DNA binding protein